MNLLTRTGLLPAVQDTGCHHNHQEQNIEISFNDIVLPAPFGFRPFSQYYNPYTNGCSILCNHPVDQETKQTIRKAKEILERKCITIHSNDIPLDYDIDDVFVPEVLFRRYTETDSRPQTPTPNTTGISSRISHPRRCITPDPSTEPERMQLVVDLRRSLSQNAMSSNEGHALSGVALSTPIVPRLSPAKKHLENVHFATTDSRYAVKGKKKSAINKDKPDGTAKNNANIRQNVKNMKDDQSKKKKKKPKGKVLKRDMEKEFKNLAEPKETQVSSYEDNPNGENIDDNASTQAEQDGNQDENKQDLYAIDPELIKQLQRELDLEIVDNEPDPQKRMVYEEIYAKSAVNRRTSAANDEIKTLRRELRLNSLITNAESLFTLPRTFSRRTARFELPMSRHNFNEMTSLQYLKLHVYITNTGHLMYNEVFKMHLDAEFTETRLLPIKKIITALGQVMGRDFTEAEQDDFFDLIDLHETSHVDFRTWCGICAMCERIFAESFAQKYMSRDEDPCHEVELVDFSLLEKKLEDTKVDPRLEKMLRKIRDI